MACCPPTALPYLAADYAAKGTTLATDGVELYMAPPPDAPQAAIILCPDVWGWNGGRVRAVADMIAAEGYLVVVGKFLSTPCFEGGTDGDALPPGGSFDMEWIKNFPWPKQAPKVAAVAAFCKQRLAESGAPCKLGVVGFCYGGHLACHASINDPDVKVGVVLHPSMQLESYAFGGDTAALMQQVPVPFCLMPAGDDEATWGEDAPFSKELRASAAGAACEWKPFHEMSHGFSCRGDLSDPAVDRDVKAAFEETKAFLAKHLSSS